MTRKKRRLWIVLACGLGVGSAAVLGLTAFSDNIVFFVAPSDLQNHVAAPGRTLRLGRAGGGRQRPARRRDRGQPTAHFRITDGRAAVDVSYVGILPDLFREGQGAVTLGVLQAGRQLPRAGGAGEARRDLHAEGRRGCAEAHGPVEPGAGLRRRRPRRGTLWGRRRRPGGDSPPLPPGEGRGEGKATRAKLHQCSAAQGRR